MNNCSPWIHEIYQGIFEICTDLGILVVNAKYAQKYTVAYTRFFAQWIWAILDINITSHIYMIEGFLIVTVYVSRGSFTTEYTCGGHFAGTLAIQTIDLVHRTIIVIGRKRKVHVSSFTSQTEFQSLTNICIELVTYV